jgi:hypothetical protein
MKGRRSKGTALEMVRMLGSGETEREESTRALE